MSNLHGMPGGQDVPQSLNENKTGHVLAGMAAVEFLRVTEERYAAIQGLATSFKAEFKSDPHMEAPLCEIFAQACGKIIGRTLDPYREYRVVLLSGRDYRCPNCGMAMVGIEYPYGHPQRYDGVSEFRCDPCSLRFGRWTNKQLFDGELEWPFGEFQESNESI